MKQLNTLLEEFQDMEAKKLLPGWAETLAATGLPLLLMIVSIKA